MHVAGVVLVLGEAAGQRAEHVLVVETAQQWEFAQFGRDHPNLGSGGDEVDLAVAHRVAQPPVDPEDAALGLDPRQHAQQPARTDALHLRHGLGRGRQVPRRRGTEGE